MVTIRKVPTPEALWVHGVIYGPSGVGKTRLALTYTGGKVLVANIEDGYMSIAGSGIDMVDLRTRQDFHDLYTFLARGQHDYQMLWVDTFTEAKRFLTAQVLSGKSHRPDSVQYSMDDYRQANEMLRQWVWLLRSLPMHVFYVCLSATSRRKGDLVTKQTLDVGESLANSLFAYSSVVGYMTVEERQTASGETARARVLHLAPSDDWDAKLRLPPGFRAPKMIVSPTLDKVLSLYRQTPKEGESNE
jgi:hypothetical protein